MLKARKNFLSILYFSLLSINLYSEEDPYVFIDSNAQEMVDVLIENNNLFLEDR